MPSWALMRYWSVALPRKQRWWCSLLRKFFVDSSFFTAPVWRSSPTPSIPRQTKSLAANRSKAGAPPLGFPRRVHIKSPVCAESARSFLRSETSTTPS